MPDKNTHLQQVQIGKESTRGTRVATVRELIDSTTLDLQGEPVISEKRGMGSRAVLTRDITGQSGMATLEQDATYNNLPVIFNSLFGTATPSGVGPYTRTYAAPDGSDPTRSFFTLLKGDASDVNSLAGAVCSSAKITAGVGEYVTISSEWVGTEVGGDTLDAVSPPTTLTYVLPQHLTVSLGALGGALTALGCDLISFEMEINTNTTNRGGLGQLAPCDFNMGELEITVSMTVTADNATGKALYEALRGTSPSLTKQDMTVLFSEGVNNSAQFDMPVTLTAMPNLYGDEDGVATVEMEFSAYLDLTGTTSFSSSCDVTLINQEATLP